jgi:hypothetical protein
MPRIQEGFRHIVRVRNDKQIARTLAAWQAFETLLWNLHAVESDLRASVPVPAYFGAKR